MDPGSFKDIAGIYSKNSDDPLSNPAFTSPTFKNPEEIIQRWYSLQRIIKEKITLQEISKYY